MHVVYAKTVRKVYMNGVQDWVFKRMETQGGGRFSALVNSEILYVPRVNYSNASTLRTLNLMYELFA